MYKYYKSSFCVLFSIIIAYFLVTKYDILTYRLCYKCPPTKFENNKSLHSQYYEDYILSYIFKHKRNAIYLDIGANEPQIDNVTKYFYDKGWNGINIEPNPGLAKLYEEMRPRDITLNMGCSNIEGEFTFYSVPDAVGWSTFDKNIAEDIKYNKKLLLQENKIKVDTLKNILSKYTSKEIAFMNIDVEGYERKVLEGMDFKKFRPIVILLESVFPNTEKPSYYLWEDILLDNNYIFAMSDGLNRYYLDIKHKDLLERFNEIDYCVKKSKIKRNINLDGFLKIIKKPRN